jgi:hypothetical protein
LRKFQNRSVVHSDPYVLLPGASVLTSLSEGLDCRARPGETRKLVTNHGKRMPETRNHGKRMPEALESWEEDARGPGIMGRGCPRLWNYGKRMPETLEL